MECDPFISVISIVKLETLMNCYHALTRILTMHALMKLTRLLF